MLSLGNHRDISFYTENNRPKSLLIYPGSYDAFECEFPDEYTDYAVVFSSPVIASMIEVQILDIYEGSKYDDTVIAEITVYVE